MVAWAFALLEFFYRLGITMLLVFTFNWLQGLGTPEADHVFLVFVMSDVLTRLLDKHRGKV